MTAVAEPVVEQAVNPLLPSQIQVLRMLADGLTNQQIARRLHIASQSVAMRVNRAAKRLGTRTTVHTVVEALRRGLLTENRHA